MFSTTVTLACVREQGSIFQSLGPCPLVNYQNTEILVRILKWVAVPFSRGSPQPRDQTQVTHITGGFFTSLATREAQLIALMNE